MERRLPEDSLLHFAGHEVPFNKKRNGYFSLDHMLTDGYVWFPPSEPSSTVVNKKCFHYIRWDGEVKEVFWIDHWNLNHRLSILRLNFSSLDGIFTVEVSPGQIEVRDFEGNYIYTLSYSSHLDPSNKFRPQIEFLSGGRILLIRKDVGDMHMYEHGKKQWSIETSSPRDMIRGSAVYPITPDEKFLPFRKIMPNDTIHGMVNLENGEIQIDLLNPTQSPNAERCELYWFLDHCDGMSFMLRQVKQLIYEHEWSTYFVHYFHVLLLIPDGLHKAPQEVNYSNSHTYATSRQKERGYIWERLVRRLQDQHPQSRITSFKSLLCKAGVGFCLKLHDGPARILFYSFFTRRIHHIPLNDFIYDSVGVISPRGDVFMLEDEGYHLHIQIPTKWSLDNYKHLEEKEKERLAFVFRLFYYHYEFPWELCQKLLEIITEERMRESI